MKASCIFFIFIMLIGCKPKKIDLSGETKIDEKEFIAIFKTLPLPYFVSDTNLDKHADTVSIGLKVFEQFFPDSMLTTMAQKKGLFKIHPVGIINKPKEKYLLFVIKEKKKMRLLTFVLNEQNEFMAGKELLNNAHKTDYHFTLNINKEPTFLISQEKINKENQLLFTREGWIYNDVGIFMVVTKDSNEDPSKTAVINPIDTIPALNKFSGNYYKDKKNYLSVRDGKNANHYLFFIHFEKNNGSCTGELKGELKLNSPKTGVFSQNGDPCIIDFDFAGNSIKLKEQGSCGNHRGIKCFFDDVYTRKKETKLKNRIK